jgi:hypothetical protein
VPCLFVPKDSDKGLQFIILAEGQAFRDLQSLAGSYGSATEIYFLES